MLPGAERAEGLSRLTGGSEVPLGLSTGPQDANYFGPKAAEALWAPEEPSLSLEGLAGGPWPRPSPVPGSGGGRCLTALSQLRHRRRWGPHADMCHVSCSSAPRPLDHPAGRRSPGGRGTGTRWALRVALLGLGPSSVPSAACMPGARLLLLLRLPRFPLAESLPCRGGLGPPPPPSLPPGTPFQLSCLPFLLWCLGRDPHPHGLWQQPRPSAQQARGLRAPS